MLAAGYTICNPGYQKYHKSPQYDEYEYRENLRLFAMMLGFLVDSTPGIELDLGQLTLRIVETNP